MRIITPKDKRGLLIAFRVFLRAMSGERLSQQAGEPILEKALGAGLTFDAILNKENWGRALALEPLMSAADYIDILIERRVDVREIKDEPLWNDTASGFSIIAEAAHDFYQEVTGKGGRWNIPSALTNLSRAIKDHSLQAVLSEGLIHRVEEGREDTMNYFAFIQALAKDFSLIREDEVLTAEQAFRSNEDDEMLDAASGEEEEPVHEETEQVHEVSVQDDSLESDAAEPVPPEDEPYPEEFFATENDANDVFDTVFITKDNPEDTKRNCLRIVLENYTPVELSGLLKTIEGAENIPISEIINHLVRGRFDISKEDAETRSLHQNISADLMPWFIECVRYQGIEMDEQIASGFDILHDDWDLRAAEVRKLHKIKRLIIAHGDEDPDLLAAMADIERLYEESANPE